MNFPGDKYDVEIIRQAATLQDYVQASRQAAKDLTRERQTSRYVHPSADGLDVQQPQSFVVLQHVAMHC